MADFALDWSFARPDLDVVVAAGVVGALRYLAFDSPSTHGKILFPAERDGLFAKGLPVALNWEQGTKNPLGGAQQGTTDGTEANRQADALGWPKDRPIFYSMDSDITARDFDAIEAYLRAATATGRPAGIYGEFDLIEAMAARGACAWFWQSGAWSYGKLSSHAHLYQRIGTILGIGGVDENVILKPDWGAWHPDRAYTVAATPPAHTHTEDTMGLMLTMGNGHLVEIIARETDGAILHRAWNPSGDKPGDYVMLAKNVPDGGFRNVRATVYNDGKRIEVHADSIKTGDTYWSAGVPGGFSDWAGT